MALKGRGPVEYLNRHRKAKMIEAFLKDAIEGLVEGFTILDVGCGNGQISEYFISKNCVFGVDVEDKRDGVVSDFQFSLIKDEVLPFDDNYFDIVISHHVIEHVNNQLKHLSEIHRVLKSDGYAYLGCPNKGSPFMAGHVGNDSVLTWREAIDLFDAASFDWEEYYTRLLSNPDKYFCEMNIGKFIPSKIIKILKPWYPSHCFILQPIGT